MQLNLGVKWGVINIGYIKLVLNSFSEGSYGITIRTIAMALLSFSGIEKYLSSCFHLIYYFAPKTECGCLRAGKLKTVAYVYPPRHREIAKEKKKKYTICCGFNFWGKNCLNFPQIKFSSNSDCFLWRNQEYGKNCFTDIID